MLVYIDQSGYYHPNDGNPFSVLGAIAFKENVLREFAHSVFNLNQLYWKKESPYEFEIKGSKLLSIRALKHQKYANYAEEVLHICKKFDGVTFAVVEPKPTQEEFESINQLYIPKAYKFLYERINQFCMECENDERGLAIFDTQDMRKDEILSQKISNYFYRTKSGQTQLAIIPEPYFVSSKISYGIQIADLIAYIVNQKFVGRKDIIHFYDLVKKSEFKSIDEEAEYRLFGIKIIKETGSQEKTE